MRALWQLTVLSGNLIHAALLEESGSHHAVSPVEGQTYEVLEKPDADLTAPRGYPLFFASFEEVGRRRIEPNVIPLADADNQIENWLEGCHADAFLVVRDSAPFDITDMRAVKRLAESSLTVGSFLTDYSLNARDLASELADYCKARLVNIAADETIEPYIDTVPRVFLIDFDRHATDKRERLEAVLHAIPSPYVAVVYTSTFAQAKPILRSVQSDPRRTSRRWRRHRPDQIVPVIGSLVDRKRVGHAAPEPHWHFPDNFFLTLLLASAITSVFLLFLELRHRPHPLNGGPNIVSGEPPAHSLVSAAETTNSSTLLDTSTVRGSQRPRPPIR